MKKITLTIALSSLLLLTFSQNIPVDFETGGNGANWTWTVFENDSNPPLQIMANPDPSGINTSATVARFIAKQNGNPWAGCETMHGSDIGTFSINSSNYLIRIMVWKNKISDVGIKLVTSSSASLGEIKVANTLVNQWEQLTFDFSAHIGGMTYDQLVVFPDYTSRNQDDTVYFDNVFGSSMVLDINEKSQMSAISVFPNPTNGLLHISSETQIDEIQLFDMTGKRLDINYNSNNLDISHFESGAYLLRLKQNGLVTTKKIIKN